MTVDAELEIEESATDLEYRVLYRSESGAFKQDDSKRQEIIKLVKKARTLAAQPDIPAAKHELLTAHVVLADVIRGMPRSWRVVHIWGIIPFSYYILLALASLEILLFYSPLIKEHFLLDVPLATVFYAFLGGVLRGLWWMLQVVSEKRFRPQFTLPYIAGPWIAALLGMLVWLLFKAGLVLLSENGATPNPLAINALVFIGGFSWQWVMDLIDMVKSKVG